MSTPEKFRVATEYTNNEAAAVALDHQLYVKDTSLQRELLSAKYNGTQRTMLVVDSQDTPVGVGMIFKGRMLYIFVNPEYRRKGIGSMLAQAIKARNVDLIGSPGNAGWEAFFKKNNIICMKLA